MSKQTFFSRFFHASVLLAAMVWSTGCASNRPTPIAMTIHEAVKNGD